MAPIDIVILLLVAIAFVAVCVRIYRKGTCADCAQGGVCTGHCSNKKTCAAVSSKAQTSKCPAGVHSRGTLRIWTRARRVEEYFLGNR